MPSAITLYDVLGVERDATPVAIAAAHAAAEHAARGNPEQLSLLHVAYDTLRDPVRRMAYDRQLAHRQATAGKTDGEIAREQRPSGGGRRRRLLALLVVSGLLAAFWAGRPEPVSMPGSPAASGAAAPAAAATSPVPATLPPAPALAAPVAPEAVANSEAGEPADRAEQAGRPVDVGDSATTGAGAGGRRPAKRPGFDARHLAWSVFTIRQRTLYGSGVLIGPDRILTNCHVLAGAAINGIVAIHSVTRKRSKVEKYARLEDEDACLLFAPGAGDEPLPWGDSATLRPGDTVHSFGHPGGGSDIIWSTGRFLERVEKRGDRFLLSSNYCRPGSSGGPLLDDQGRLVGIVAAVRYFQSRVGEAPRYGACISVSEAVARALLGKPLFPIALAPARYFPND